MSTFNLLSFGLVLHITGIALMAGSTLGVFVSLRQLWKYVPSEQQKAALMLRNTSGYTIFFGLGAALILISGFLLLRAFQFSVTGQAWFRIKMGLVVLLFLNARIVAVPVIKKLQQLLSEDANAVMDLPQLFSLKRRLSIFHVVQFAMFLVIFVLAVYRF
jgi:uncharacterized membrane protein